MKNKNSVTPDISDKDLAKLLKELLAATFNEENINFVIESFNIEEEDYRFVNIYHNGLRKVSVFVSDRIDDYFDCIITTPYEQFEYHYIYYNDMYVGNLSTLVALSLRETNNKLNANIQYDEEWSFCNSRYGV